MPASINCWTDGACRGNPGAGGWGVFLKYGDGRPSRELCGGERQTTNNRQEIRAVLVALCETEDCPDVTIFTDSQYVVKGATSWMPGWKKKGWKTASGAPVKNKDLWMEMDEYLTGAATAKRTVRLKWVRGHAGNPGNEKADALANRGIGSIQKKYLHLS